MSNTNYTLIGLTGPTGAGKSTVTKMFRESGFAVVDADEIAHKALEDKACIAELVRAFGNEILAEDGSINRRKTAQTAFSSAENTKALNSITHPVILRLAYEEFERLQKIGFKRIIFDAPTLFESGSDRLCQKIISVVAPIALRTERILHRDGISKAEAESRINAQKPDEFYIKNSDCVIDNSGDLFSLQEQVNRIIKELMNE